MQRTRDQIHTPRASRPGESEASCASESFAGRDSSFADAGADRSRSRQQDDADTRPGGRAEHADAGDARHDAEGGGRQWKDIAEEGRQAASDAAAEAREQAMAAAEWARREFRSAIDGQRTRLAEKLEHLTRAIECAAETLREEGDENLAELTQSIHRHADEAAAYLREHDSDSIMRDAERCTRDRPELVLGGLFAAGLALSRFLKAAPRPHDGQAVRASRRSREDQSPTGEPAPRASAPASEGGAPRSYNPGGNP